MADDLKVRTEAPEAEPDFMIKFMVADSGNDAGTGTEQEATGAAAQEAGSLALAL